MSAVKAIRALLIGDNGVLSLCSAANIMAGDLPAGIALPGLSIKEVSTVDQARIDANSSFSLVTTRVQVTAVAKDYPSVKSLVRAARLACNYQRGDIAGIAVVRIVRDTVGPDLSNDEATIYLQSIDFKVTFEEPNQ